MLTHLKIIPNTELNKFYSYLVQNDKEIVYIGVGKIIDILTFKTLMGNPNFNGDESHTIIIYKGFEKHHQAMNDISKIIKENGGRTPALNISIGIRSHGRIKCKETGVVYKNQAEACRVMNIDQPRLSHHLKGKSGYKTIYGMTYQYLN